MRESLAAHSRAFDTGPDAKKDLCRACRAPGGAVQDAEARLRDKALHGDPLGPALRESIAGLSTAPFKVCETCVGAIKAREEASRRDLWARLPKMTGVES